MRRIRSFRLSALLGLVFGAGLGFRQRRMRRGEKTGFRQEQAPVCTEEPTQGSGEFLSGLGIGELAVRILSTQPGVAGQLPLPCQERHLQGGRACNS